MLWNVMLPATSTGASRSILVPSPSSPLTFAPQQYAVPLAVSPQACKGLRVRLVNLMPPDTGVGTSRVVVVPSPSWPRRLSPQHRTSPADVRPHANPATPPDVLW